MTHTHTQIGGENPFFIIKELLAYIFSQITKKKYHIETQDGNSLIISIILIAIDFPCSWEFFISMGDTFHGSRNDMNQIKMNESKIKHFLAYFWITP